MPPKDLRIRSKSISTKGRRVGRTCIALLDKDNLVDDVAIETAICSLESHIVDGGIDIEELLTALESIPHLLEFVLSATNEYSFQVLHGAILEGFPHMAAAFDSSLASRLLHHFSVILLFLPPQSTNGAFTLLNQHRHAVELAAPLLKSLATVQFAEEAVNEDESISPTSPTKRRSQKTRKQSMRASRAPVIDPQPFDNYGVSVPTSQASAMELSATVLEEQKAILKYYLNIFRNPDLASTFKNTYLPPVVPEVRPTPAKQMPTDAQPTELTHAPESKGAYPFVQPIKAALYFDSAKGFGQWRILISNGAAQDLRQARRKDPTTFGIIINKIKALSNGHFSDDNQKRLTGVEIEVPIYEAKMTRDTRLVYQIDCVPEFESDVERQVIRVFGIYSHAQLDHSRLWDGVGRQLGRKGAEYRRRCNYRLRPLGGAGDVFVPGSWPPMDPSEQRPSTGLTDIFKEDLEEMHSLLVLEKFITFSQALLNSILADQDVTHPFDVSPQEKKIIEHPSSCYVLGRSGTGKTTTMLFKMLGIERSWETFREALPRPRQLFVTQSRVLAEKVEEYFTKLFESLSTAGQTNSDLVNIVARRKRQQEQGLVDQDEEVWHRGDLPQRFGELTDEHFPMFLTYDQICRLLETEFHHLNEERQKNEAVTQSIQDAIEFRGSSSTSEGWTSDRIQKHRESFISERVFCTEYWPHFPQGLSKNLDPTLVFAEFMGVIKGSEQALEKPQGYLDKEGYCNLSARTQATFASQRESIYRLFQAYLKRKRERGDWDAADRTHALIRSLRGGVPGQDFDFLYVDEAQDNLLIDALVLRALCRNPHGLFWAGDTAQTISAGSAFRFDDLKAFLYRIEEGIAGSNNLRRVQPESFQLAVNYRSHAGIVNSAHTVIKLITEFWPHAIDTLAEEKGLIDGLKPVFFSGWDQDSVRYEQFLFGESGSHIEFGAQQCILVRDDAARDKLRAQVGNIGLILTLYEAKGLEFNDVLLFNFFEDSTADLSQWRVVLNTLPRNERSYAPRFDEIRHNSICRELKFLYVAITRARKNLWIADSSEKADPMRMIWSKNNQVETCTPGSDVPKLAMSSSPEEWAATARSLFNNRRYPQAMHCYERAGMTRERAVAQAYHLRERARSASPSQREAYVTAAEAFLASARDAITEKNAYYRIAAECFAHCEDHARAAKAYFDASEYDLAAQYYRKAGNFDEAVEVIRSHKSDMSPSVVENITEVSKLFFLREQEVVKARELFETDEEALEYMDDFGLNIARASLLEKLGKYAEAAELLFEEGNTLEAVRLLTLDRDNEESMKRAIEFVLSGLWSALSFGVSVTEQLVSSHPTLGKLLELVMGFRSDAAGMDKDSWDEIAMFQAIAAHKLPALVQLSHEFLRRRNHAATALCLDHIFASSPQLESTPLQGIISSLSAFLAYCQLLQVFVAGRDLTDNPVVRKLFNLHTSTEDLFVVPKDAWILTGASERLLLRLQSMEHGYVVPRWEVDNLLKSRLRERLLHKVNEENEAIRKLHFLRPCLGYAIHLQCRREGCPRYHGDLEYYSPLGYNMRVRIQLLQLLIYRTVESIESFPNRIRQKRNWITQLHATLITPHHSLGGLHLLSPSHIANLQQVLRLVSLWMQDVLFHLEPWRVEYRFLTQLAQCAQLAFTLDRRFSPQYLRKVRCISTFRPPELMRNAGDIRSYIVHDLMSFLEGQQQNSLNRAFIFLKFVIEQNVPIDITVLCDIVDHLCGCLILATRGRNRSAVTLNNVTLPKSWILRLAPHFHALPFKDFNLSFLYLRNMGELLERIYSGSAEAGHLLYENTNLGVGGVGFSVRNIFMVRILRNLCLWGYNIEAPKLRNEILRTVSSLRQPGRTFSSTIEDYVGAVLWAGLERAVRNSFSFSKSSCDELVKFHHSSQRYVTSARNVKDLVYERLQDIPKILGADQPGIFDVMVPPAQINTRSMQTQSSTIPLPVAIDASRAASEAHPVTSGSPAQELDGEIVENEIEQDVVVMELEPQAASDVDDITRAIDSGEVDSGPKTPSLQEVEAANTIVACYRRHSSRMSSGKRKTYEVMKHRLYAAFREEAKKISWPHTFYRLLFLGPLPHLLAVVEAMKNSLYEAKNSAKQRLNIVQHLELETVRSSLTEINRRFKEAERLHKVLSPTSELHRSRDVEKLKLYTHETESLMQSFPETTAQRWRDDLSIALRAITEDRKVKTMHVEKPVLNVEDDDLVYYDA
ncbi:hypothetical protein C8Q74DRAFT_1336826 [Fomes fomentarius]|nr:hypothetical protein C8Q74DRAFT_1336826 [Fomes fomentarius]